MNTYFSAFKQAVLVGTAAMFATSCVITDPVADPYFVYEDRQQENVYYVPSGSYSPLSSEKNHFDLNIVRALGRRYGGFDVQAGYMVSNRVGITGVYSGAVHPDGTPHHFRNNRVEFGAGYVTRMKKGWHFETYGGIGNGRLKNFHYSGTSELRLNHYFIQPGFVYNSPSQLLTIGFMSRFAGVNFNVQDTLFSTDRERLSAKHLTSLYDQPFHLMWEPGITINYGWKHFKLNTGYNYSADLTNSNLHRPTGRFTLGLKAELNFSKK